jgi:hypothetical protein
MRLHLRIVVGCALCLALAPATGAGAQTAAAEGSNPHVTDEAGFRSALASLSSSPVPSTITLDADIVLDDGTDPTYTGTQPLTIDGQGFTLSGNDESRVLTATGGTKPLLVLRDITVSDGYTTGSGGAVDWPGPVTVQDATFRDNRVDAGPIGAGGAVYGSTLITIDNSRFEDNLVTASTGNANGGAVYANQTGATVNITSSVFRGNRVDAAVTDASGGAVFAIASVDIQSSVFLDNTAEAGQKAKGGAVQSSDVLTAAGSLFYDNGTAALANSQSMGGALYSVNDLTVTDSTVWQNQSTSATGHALGSGMNGDHAVVLDDVTIVDNTAAGSVSHGAINAGSLDADHATITANTGTTGAAANLEVRDGADLVGTVIGEPIGGVNCDLGSRTATGSVDDDGTCLLPAGDGNLVNAGALLLGPVRDNGGPIAGPDVDQFSIGTRFPLAGSPVIDAVASGSCGDLLDQRGITRPFDAGCDAGSVEAVFEPHPFTDVDPWVEDAVRWLASGVNDPPLMVGITSTTFRPDARILRGQVVRLLYRLEGAPDPLAYPPHPFTDVPRWVEGAVRWAYGEGIVTGETPTLFKPIDPITRGQVVRMLYRIAGSPDVTGIDPPPFDDVPNWVADAIQWAANPDNPLPIMTGETPTQFNAEEPILRGQVARAVWRLAITPAAWADPGAAPDTVPFVAPPLV